eukprot:3963173-Prymnesium_polylepis.1
MVSRGGRPREQPFTAMRRGDAARAAEGGSSNGCGWRLERLRAAAREGPLLLGVVGRRLGSVRVEVGLLDSGRARDGDGELDVQQRLEGRGRRW